MTSIPNANSKNFTREQAQTINSINTIFNPINEISNFISADSKIEKQFNYEYHHWKANKKVINNINKSEKSTKTLRLTEKRQKIRKPAKLRLKLDSNKNRKKGTQTTKQTKERRDGRN